MNLEILTSTIKKAHIMLIRQLWIFDFLIFEEVVGRRSCNSRSLHKLYMEVSHLQQFRVLLHKMNNLNSNIRCSTMSKLPSKRNALDSKFSHYSLFLVQLSRKFSICRYNLHTFSLRYLALCCLRIPSSFERTMATDRVFVGSIA